LSKSGRFAGKTTTFWVTGPKWSLGRPSDHFWKKRKSGRSAGKSTTFATFGQKVKKWSICRQPDNFLGEIDQ